MTRLRVIGHKLTVSGRTKLKTNKPTNPFYLSPEWRGLVEAEIARRFGSRANSRCEDRACEHPERRGIRVFGDHIHELGDHGAPLDPTNVLFRCGSCHTRKTAAERARRLGLIG